MTDEIQSTSGISIPASIIIATHNRCNDLLECLGSLEKDLQQRQDVEVIVVDDASNDDTSKEVEEQYPWVKVIRMETQQFASAARNAGARAAKGSLLLFLDSDGLVEPGWLETMLAADNGDTVLLGCPVDYEGGRVQGTPRRATFLGKSLRCRPERADTGPSCNLGVPRKCFDVIGGFDEELPYYFEDSDLCIRARKAGFTFRYLPDAVFRHKGNERKKGDAVRMQERNSVYAMLKAYHTSPLQRAVFSIFNGVWLVVRVVGWSMQGRGGEVQLLLRGWREGYTAYREKFRL